MFHPAAFVFAHSFALTKLVKSSWLFFSFADSFLALVLAFGQKLPPLCFLRPARCRAVPKTSVLFFFSLDKGGHWRKVSGHAGRHVACRQSSDFAVVSWLLVLRDTIKSICNSWATDDTAKPRELGRLLPPRKPSPPTPLRNATGLVRFTWPGLIKKSQSLDCDEVSLATLRIQDTVLACPHKRIVRLAFYGAQVVVTCWFGMFFYVF